MSFLVIYMDCEPTSVVMYRCICTEWYSTDGKSYDWHAIRIDYVVMGVQLNVMIKNLIASVLTCVVELYNLSSLLLLHPFHKLLKYAL